MVNNKMPIQTRQKNGETQYRWGNTGKWFNTESQAHKQGMAIQAEQSRQSYAESGKVGSKAVETQLKKRKQLRQAGNWTEIKVK